ncbi:MAG: hypothetical protein PUE12_01775 [Oscillospiraceae bacterium]|nr:hypothetical protein [Oscillospiraceae bacterium]
MNKKVPLYIHMSPLIIHLFETIKSYYRLEKDSDVIHYSFEKANENLSDINWKQVSDEVSKFNFNKSSAIENSSSSKNFYIKNEIYTNIYSDICSELNCTKPRIIFIIKLVLTYTYLQIPKNNSLDFNDLDFLQTVHTCFKLSKTGDKDKLIPIINKFIEDIENLNQK